MANGTGSHWSLSTKLGLSLWALTGAMFVYNVRKDGLMGLSGNYFVAMGGALVAIGSVQSGMVPTTLK